VQISAYTQQARRDAYILKTPSRRPTLVHAGFVECDARGAGADRQGWPELNRRRSGHADRADATDWDHALSAASPEVPPRLKGGDGGGVIVYTSGTTASRRARTAAGRKTGFESVGDMIVQCGMRTDDRHLSCARSITAPRPRFVSIMLSLGATSRADEPLRSEGALDIIQREKIHQHADGPDG